MQKSWGCRFAAACPQRSWVMANFFYTVETFYFIHQQMASSSGGPFVLVQDGALSSSSYLHD